MQVPYFPLMPSCCLHVPAGQLEQAYLQCGRAEAVAPYQNNDDGDTSELDKYGTWNTGVSRHAYVLNCQCILIWYTQYPEDGLTKVHSRKHHNIGGICVSCRLPIDPWVKTCWCVSPCWALFESDVIIDRVWQAYRVFCLTSQPVSMPVCA